MFRFRTLAVVSTLATLSTASLAQDDPHKAHHPAGAASAAPMPGPAAGKSPGMQDIAMMDKHMKAMQAMHEKMAGAKTAAAREALMAEHVKLVQEGMSMMQMMMDRMPMSPAAAAK